MRRAWLGLFLLTGCSFDDGGTATQPDAILVTVDSDGVCDINDEDGDFVGNACDNCPHVANEDQADREADGAGDACDPQPDTTGNALLYFEGFDSAAALDDWRVFNGGTWTVSDGALHQLDPDGSHTLYLGSQTFDGAYVATHFVIDEIGASVAGGFGPIVTFANGAGEGAGYSCWTYDNYSLTAETASVHLLTLRGAAAYEDEGAVVASANLAAGMAFDVTVSHRSDNMLTCGVSSEDFDESESVTSTDAQFSNGPAAVRTQFLSAHVDYVAVFAMP